MSITLALKRLSELLDLTEKAIDEISDAEHGKGIKACQNQFKREGEKHDKEKKR